MSAQVILLYFAQSSELAGVRSEVVALPTTTSTSALWEEIVRLHPRLSLLQGRVVLAVRQQYVAPGNHSVILRDGDEVAVIPPLSGG